MRRLLALAGAACIVALWSCADDEETPPVDTLNEVDLPAVRAILDANDLTGIAPLQVATPDAGYTRVIELNLRPSATGGATIDTIPPDIGRLTGLTTLFLDNNGIRSLPPQIGALRGLTYLSATYNSLQSLPAELMTLPALEDLMLSHNQITAIPSTVGGLSRLQALRIDYNLLQGLPYQVTALNALVEFDFTHNNVCDLDTNTQQWLINRNLITVDWKTAQDGCP